MLDEKGLIALCDRLNIEISKANGELYNNKEKEINYVNTVHTTRLSLNIFMMSYQQQARRELKRSLMP